MEVNLVISAFSVSPCFLYGKSNHFSPNKWMRKNSKKVRQRCCVLGKCSKTIRKIVDEVILPTKSKTNWICDTHRDQNHIAMKVFNEKCNPHLVLSVYFLKRCFSVIV